MIKMENENLDKPQYKHPIPFFPFFLFAFSLGLLAITNTLLVNKKTNTRSEAATPSCNIFIDGHQPALFRDPVALRKGSEVLFTVQCSDFNFARGGEFSWNFGDNSCSSWQTTSTGPTLAYSKLAHTFNQNGDYWVSVFAKVGGATAFTKIKVGVYEQAAFGQTFVDHNYLSQGTSTRELAPADFGLSLDTKFAGYQEMGVCDFYGTTQFPATAPAYREVIPASNATQFSQYKFRLEEPSSLNVGDWRDAENCHAITQNLLFWDRNGWPTRNNVDRLVYKLRTAITSAEDRSETHMSVSELYVIHRKASEYVEYPACAAPGQPNTSPTPPLPTVTPLPSGIVPTPIIKKCQLRVNCPNVVCQAVASCTNQVCVYVPRPNGFNCGGGKACDGFGSCVAKGTVSPTPTSIPLPTGLATPSAAPTPKRCASRTDCPTVICMAVSACSNQQCVYVARPLGTVCATGKKCDGNGNCVAQ